MASITRKKKGKYLKKESSSDLTQVFLETLDSQVVFENDIVLNGVTYHKQGVTGTDTAFDKYGKSVADILAIIGSSGGKYRLVAGATANIVKLQTSTDGGSVWTDVSTITVDNVANATAATNVNLSAGTSTGTAGATVTATNNKFEITAGAGDKAIVQITSVPSATNAENATNATNATNVDLTGSTTMRSTPGLVIDGVIKVEPIEGSMIIPPIDVFTIKAGNGEDASIRIESVNKAYRDLSGNIIEETYATKAEVSGRTGAYVTDSAALTGSKFAGLLINKTAEQKQVTVSATISDSLPLINSGSASVQNLKVGDTIYITDANYCDWFIASYNETSQGNVTILFTSVEADSPVLDNFVSTNSTLPENEIIVGNGNKSVKSSGVTVSSTALTNASTGIDTHILTEKATQATIKNNIAALDVDNITGMGAGKTIATLTETDGKIAATFQDISITKSQVSDFPDIPTGFTISVTDGLLKGTGGVNSVEYAPYTTAGAGHLYTGTANPTNTNRLNYDGYFYATALYSGGREVLTSHATITGSAPINVLQNAQTGAASITHDVSGVTAGTYSAVTVDTYGHVTAGAQMIKYVDNERADVSDVAIGGTVVVLGDTVQFKFNIAEYTGLTAEPNMTWGQWLESDYHLVGVIASGSNVMFQGKYIAYNGVKVTTSDLIVEVRTYEMISE